MSEKTYRKAAVAEILRSRKIHTQEELIDALKSEGICVTQATLSRDIKELGAIKAPDSEEGTVYIIPQDIQHSHHVYPVSIETSGQLCVVHSQPGFASAVASVIDKSRLESVMGTIAGDDTILLMLRENADEKMITARLQALFQTMNDKQ